MISSEETLTNATIGETVILDTQKTFYTNTKAEKIIVAFGVISPNSENCTKRSNTERAEAIGIKGFLMKPVARSELAQMVRNVPEKYLVAAQG